MAQCRPNCDLPVMGMGAQSKNKKVLMSVVDPIEGCINIKTSWYDSISSSLGDVEATFNPNARPTDMLNCPEPLCITSGTLYVSFLSTPEELDPETGDIITPAEIGTTSVDYTIGAAAIDYVNGVLNSYVELTGPGSYDVTFNINDKCTDSSSDVTYTQTVTGSEEEAYPKTVQVQFPMSEAEGFLPSTDCGMRISVSITPLTEESAENPVGISSISMVKDPADYEQNDVVTVTCVDEVDFPMDVDLTDPTCLDQSPDDTSVTLELTLTAQQVTGNYMRLNSLAHLQDETEIFDVNCKTKTIAPITVNGVDLYGVRLENYDDTECSFLSAYLPACNAIEGRLAYSQLINLVEPDLEAFKIAIDSETGEAYMYFNSDFDGETVTIQFPIKRDDAIIYELNTDFVEGRRIRVVIPYEQANGYHGYIMSYDAFTTSFPFGWSSTEDTPFEFTLTFKRVNNSFGKVVMFTDDKLTNKGEW